MKCLAKVAHPASEAGAQTEPSVWGLGSREGDTISPLWQFPKMKVVIAVCRR